MSTRHVSGDPVVALIEILSSRNKASNYASHAFIDKALGAYRQGVHLSILDVYPPTPRAPYGVHGVIWEQLTTEAYLRPDDDSGDTKRVP